MTALCQVLKYSIIKLNMSDVVLKFLLSIPQLDQDDCISIAKDLDIKIFYKDNIIKKQSEKTEKCYFVLKGCIRQYFIDEEGNEHTTNFFTEYQPIITNKNYSLICNEDSILMDGSPEKEELILKKHPKLKPIIKSMEEVNFRNLQDDFANFISSSPEERYLKIVKDRPDLITRVPQHQLASFLGIKPESLSRLKKRLSLTN